MKLQIKFFAAVLLIWVAAPSWLQAQCDGFSYEFLDGNQVSARFTAGTDRFWNLVDAPSYEVPRGSGKDVSFASGLWIGGLDPTNSLHVAGATYRQAGNDFFTGPIRQGTAYNCGRGFTTPYNCLKDGMLVLQSGKIASFYPYGFQVYDPLTQTSIQRILPNDFAKFKAVELPNGDLVLVSWALTLSDISVAMVFDANGFPMPQPDTLLVGHPRADAVVMANGKVLVAGYLGTEIYDPVAHVTTFTAGNPLVPGFFRSVSLPSGKVWVTGSNDSALYDPATDTWSAAPVLNGASRPLLTVLPGGDILLSGGAIPTAATLRYNPSSNTVVAGPTFPEPMTDHATAVISATELMVSQGLPGQVTNDIFVLDLVSGAVRSLRFTYAALPIAFDGINIVSGLGNGDDFVYIDPTTGTIRDQRWQDVWKVSKLQVQQFRQDFASQSVNFANYSDIGSWPGNGNVWAGEDAQLAPYIDMDNDGIYDPLHDGDYPCFPGDLALWWVYNDDGLHTETGGAPLGVQVENLAYVFDCNVSPCPDTALDYTTFYHVELTNHGQTDLHDVMIGNWMDVDLGNYSDDYVGCDSALGLAFVYNGDANDETQSGYGLNPPAFGAVILPNGEIDAMGAMTYYENDFSVIGNPENAAQFYGYLRSSWKDGSPMVNNGLNGYLPAGAGSNTNFAFSGDPGFCGGSATGWSEASAGRQPFDRRLLQSVGPLTMGVGQEVALDYALVYSRSMSNDNLGNVCLLKSDAAAIKNWWSGSMDRECLSLITAKPDAQAAAPLSVQVFPNPNHGDFTIDFSSPQKQAVGMKLHNLQGQVVWEGQLNVGKTSLDVATDGLASGLYLLQMTDGQTRMSQKVVITH